MGIEQARALVRESMKKLPDQERQLLDMYYYQERNLEQMGAMLGLSKSWTCRLHARAIARLQGMLEEASG